MQTRTRTELQCPPDRKSWEYARIIYVNPVEEFQWASYNNLASKSGDSSAGSIILIINRQSKWTDKYSIYSTATAFQKCQSKGIKLKSLLQWRRDSFLCFHHFPESISDHSTNTGKKSNKEGKCSRPFPQSSEGRVWRKRRGIGPDLRGIGYAHSKMAPTVSPPAAVGRTNDSQRRKQMSPTLSPKSLPHLQLCGI